MFLLVLTILAFPIHAQNSNSGYEEIHTRVLHDNIELIEPKSISHDQFGSMLKYDLQFEIWNPTASTITKTLKQGYPVFMLNSSDNFELELYYHQGNQDKINFPTGITTINVSLTRYWDIPEDSPLNDGDQQMQVKPFQVHGMKNVVSVISTVVIKNNKTTDVIEGNIPNDWGKLSPTTSDLWIKINHIGLHALELKSEADFSLRFAGEYWNPSDKILKTGSPSDCYDRMQIHHQFDVQNDLVFSTNGLCHSTAMIYEFQPGIHTWSEVGSHFTIYNLNDTKIPDGTYTFLFQAFQKPDLVFKGYMHVLSHSLTFDYDQLPEYWGNSSGFYGPLAQSSSSGTAPVHLTMTLLAIGAINLKRRKFRNIR